MLGASVVPARWTEDMIISGGALRIKTAILSGLFVKISKRSNMKSFDYIKNAYVETPQAIVEFFDEIEAVCRKYELSISHEDGQGAFLIEPFNEDNIKWFREAGIDFRE